MARSARLGAATASFTSTVYRLQHVHTHTHTERELTTTYGSDIPGYSHLQPVRCRIASRGTEYGAVEKAFSAQLSYQRFDNKCLSQILNTRRLDQG